MNLKNCSFVILAAGKGARMNTPFKQFRLLGGIPLWVWGVKLGRKLYDMNLICEVVVVFPKDYDFSSHVEVLQAHKMPFKAINGGDTRAMSSILGVKASDGDYVLVHDAARPLASSNLVKKIISALSPEAGVIPLIPVRDSLKRVSEVGEIVPVSRENLWCTQTPQAFPRRELISVIEMVGDGVFDEAEAWIKTGRHINFVEGEPSNVKITYESDFKLCHNIVEGMSPLKVGHGFDIHPLRPWRKLILAGEFIPSAPLGLDGHSDGDVISHAVADALLGAAGEPDLGSLYPSSDERYKNANSLLILEEIAHLLFEKAWILISLDVTLEAQIPKLGCYVDTFKTNLERALSVLTYRRCDIVNLKIKSGEGVGAVGTARCMRCHAVAAMRGAMEW
jgi:2-C-methyl-D-erythritol 4-phosphate cytidylyltransferase/2-C-methyl-D-erythritol 2,4-cyclodiphosphate synthase